MSTDPKDNKGGDLAEIKDLEGRKPKGTVTRRKLFAEQKTGTLEKFRAQQARKDVGKTRTVNHSRSLFEQRQAMVSWAAQEKSDIESGTKKVPTTSNEKFMTEKNKPLKTALIREVEPGRNRQKSANQLKTLRHYIDKTKHFQSDRSAMAAVETGEAQAFVGKMKPGVDMRTQQHHLQSREFPKTPANDGIFGAGRKDLGRATVNVIKSEAGKADGGSLMALAKKRQAAGRSIAGPDPAPADKKPRWNAKKGNPGGKPAGAMPDYIDAPEYKKGKGDEAYFPKKLTID